MIASRKTWALLAPAFVLGACVGDPPPQTKPTNKTLTLGELVYRVIDDDLAMAKTCGPQYTSQLTPHHDDFVHSLDETITKGLDAGLSNILGKTIQPSVADGSLPLLVHRVGEALDLLVSDSFDPKRETLQAMLSLSGVPTLFETTMVSSLVSALLGERDLPARIHAMRLLGEENDGVDYVLSDVLSLVLASDDASSAACPGVSLDDVQGTVLRSQGFVEDPAYSLGTAAWMVRPDAHGNPRVLVDSTTGKLAAPFVDRDNDGAADVDSAGHPVDASGAIIDLPFLGTSGRRDPLGRALNEHGGLLYEYYDVKRTALSFAAQMAVDFLAGGLHHQLPPLVDAILGKPAICQDGTTTCRYYPGADHPLADLTHLLLEALRFPKAKQLMDVLYIAFTSDPVKAEDFLVALGDLANAFAASSLAITDTAFQDALIDLVPLLQDIFNVTNSDGQSTGRLLVDLLASMTPDEKAQISASLGWMVEFQSLVARPNPTPVGTSVDYSAPRYTNGTDNRSGLERTIELLDYANCGSLLGHSVAYSIIDLAADLDPATVQGLINLALGGLGVSGGLGETIVRGALTAFGCEYDRTGLIYDHLKAVDVLAKSGGLDWLLPLGRVFKERGQIQVLIDIFGYLAADLRADEGGGTATVSSIRRLEPVILTAVKAGALTKLFLEIDVLHKIQVPGTTDRATHLAVDTMQYLIQEQPVDLRTGTKTSSLAVEILKALRRLSARVGTSGPPYEAFSSLIGFARQYLASTTSGGRRVLVHPNVRLLAAVGLKAFADLADVTPESYGCIIDRFETDSEKFLTGRDFATLVRVGKLLSVSPNARALEDWLVGLLRGKPDDPTADTYGPILQILAAGASAKVAADDLDQILKWLKAVAAHNRGQALELVAAVDDLLARDKDGSMMQVMRNVIGPGVVASGASPLQVFADVYADVSSVEPSDSCRLGGDLTLSRLEEAVAGTRDFLLDDVGGITSIWKLIGTPAPEDN
jgi:hypothetical protein